MSERAIIEAVVAANPLLGPAEAVTLGPVRECAGVAVRDVHHASLGFVDTLVWE